MNKYKFFLSLLVFIFTNQFVNAETLYSLQGTRGIYSNTPIKFSNAPRINKQSSTTQFDSEFMRVFLAGAGLATGHLSILSNPAINNSSSPMRIFLDPYIVTINDKNYVLVKDSKDNNWTPENILGYNDSKDKLFYSLKMLESDGNSLKLTEHELKNANIRFVLLNKDGTLELNDRTKDFDLKKVQYIDMKNLRTALGNKNQDGTFGYFYVVVKDGSVRKTYPGRVTFEEQEDLNKYIK